MAACSLDQSTLRSRAAGPSHLKKNTEKLPPTHPARVEDKNHREVCESSVCFYPEELLKTFKSSRERISIYRFGLEIDSAVLRAAVCNHSSTDLCDDI